MHKIKNITNPLESSPQYSLKGFYSMHRTEYAKNTLTRHSQKYSLRPKEEIFLNAFKIDQYANL